MKLVFDNLNKVFEIGDILMISSDSTDNVSNKNVQKRYRVVGIKEERVITSSGMDGYSTLDLQQI